jgi:hypothetical protein
MTITVKKKRSETGAKNVMRAARGPGLMGRGSSIPSFWPVTRLWNVQPSRQPLPSRVFVEGEIVPPGKSMLSKSVCMSRVKSRTWATPAGPKA